MLEAKEYFVRVTVSRPRGFSCNLDQAYETLEDMLMCDTFREGDECYSVKETVTPISTDVVAVYRKRAEREEIETQIRQLEVEKADVQEQIDEYKSQLEGESDA